MVNESLILKYFPDISAEQTELFGQLERIYKEQNARVNLISRKDFDNFYIHHVLHSLTLAAYCKFPDRSSVIDIGTGGGFPGIPLAILFPKVQFTLVDSIGKKIRAVQDVAAILDLKNVTAINSRTEEMGQTFDIAVARAVAPMIKLWDWMDGQWKNKPLFYLLKGGDLSQEMSDLLNERGKIAIQQHSISEKFDEPFFETKKIVELKG